jgi:peptidoglycan hydrolase-like protein with peptidoglycan-binding domain
MRTPGKRRGRRWFVVAAVGSLVAFAGAGTAAVGLGNGPEAPAAQPAPATAKVHRTTLVDSQTFTGNLEYSDPTPMTSRLSGTVTRLPQVGQVVQPGDALYWIDNQPILLMAGNMPAFRPLAVNTKGPDVRQLEKNLRALGYTGFTVDDTFTAGTADAVKRWQKRRGLAETGVVELGRVLFQPGPLRVGTHKVRVGDQTGAGPLYESTSTVRRVVLSIELKYRHLAPQGGRATVVLPGGKTVAGIITDTEATDQQNDQQDSGTAKAKVTVKIADQKAFDGYDQGPVDVRLVKQERKNVLAVPIVALLALDGDRYGVEVVTGRRTNVVRVEVGLFAAGKVEIRGAGIAEGIDVSVPAT